MKKCVTILLTFFTLLGIANSQPEKCIIKLKKNVPDNIITGLKNNNIKTQNNSLSKIIVKYNISGFRQLSAIFEKAIGNDELHKAGIDRIFVFTVEQSNKISTLNELSTNEFVDYATENVKFKLESVEFTPNDTYYGNQYYLNKINVSPVWDFQQNVNVITGIFDSGMDFLHPDLNQSYLINPGEYGNGKESNGIDDDNNGFIDDWRGWNFVNNNNDPSDDNIYSHGTCVAGIISAGFNNGIGITPVTGNTKSLILKCFNSQGIGYEDQIATAVLYAISRGVKIFNFSFGDYIYSNLLRDVIEYAYSKDIIIVCSAGNDNSDVLHYPSAFDEVISVSASDDLDQKAGFSSFGNTVDIYAPGSNILTTSRTGMGSQEFGGNYILANGTSFSAPIVASIAAILKEKNPSLRNEEIRGLLVSTARYFPQQNGWDYVYSSGIANASSAFHNYNNPSTARIFHPALNQGFTGTSISFYITAASAFFTSYSLGYYIGGKNGSFTQLFNSSNQVVRDTVFKWNFSGIPDTVLTLQLKINANNGKTIEHRTIINKDSKIPAIKEYYNNETIYNDEFAESIFFSTDKPTLGMIYYKRKGFNEPYRLIYMDDGSIGYYSNYHFANLIHGDFILDSEYEYYLQAKGLNGLIATKTDTGFTFRTKAKISRNGYTKKNYNLPLSQVCGTVEDILNTGSKTLLANNVQNNLNLEAYNFSGGKFVRVSGNWIGNYIARDIILNNGKWNLLTSKQRSGSIFESNIGELPSNNIWNSASSDEFWSSCYSDVDKDGTKEILGFGKTGVVIMKNPGNTIATLPYLPQGKNNYANSQNILISDFDNNGKTDIIFTNSYIENNKVNTSINVYEHKGGNTYLPVFTESYPLSVKGDNLFKGNFEDNNKQEFGIGLFYPDNGNRQFEILFFKSESEGKYVAFASNEFNIRDNFQESFSKAGNTDNDLRDEVIINTGGNLYILKYYNQKGKFEPVYYSPEYNSYNAILYDFDNNGTIEIGLNNKDSLVFIEKDSPFTGPETPANFNGYSIDSNKVFLNFSSVSGAQYYKIYRSDSLQFILIDSSLFNNYTDFRVQNRQNYYYKITSVDTNLTTKESKPTEAIKVYVHNKSKLISSEFNNGLLFIRFSEKISLSIPSVNCFIINGNEYPKSIGIKNQYEYIISFNRILDNGIYSIRASGLTDFYYSPVDTNSVQFSVNIKDSAVFYLKNVRLLNSNILRAEFNLNTDSVTSLDVTNYSFEPFDLKVVSIERDETKNVLKLKINSKGNIGPSGKIYFLRVDGIYSENGVKITQGSGSIFSLSFVKEDLSEVITYPNPFVSSKSLSKVITFANLTKTAHIYVFDLAGNKIKELIENNGDGGAEWDTKDSNGNDLPTGIYIYVVEGKNSNGEEVKKKIGKFAIVR